MIKASEESRSTVCGTGQRTQMKNSLADGDFDTRVDEKDRIDEGTSKPAGVAWSNNCGAGSL
jgi:hypothetical protein